MGAIKNFEGNLKFVFDPFSEDCDDEFEVPLPGAPDIPDIGLEEGYLKLSKYQFCLGNSNFLEKKFCKRFSCRPSLRSPSWCKNRSEMWRQNTVMESR
jgi:hypothetical protein